MHETRLRETCSNSSTRIVGLGRQSETAFGSERVVEPTRPKRRRAAAPPKRSSPKQHGLRLLPEIVRGLGGERGLSERLDFFGFDVNHAV